MPFEEKTTVQNPSVGADGGQPISQNTNQSIADDSAEINENFGLESKQMLENKGFKNVALLKDLSNKNRILRGSI